MAEITIPGDPGGLSALSSRLRTAAGDVESVGRSVSSNSLEGSWSGPASQAFRSSLQPLPGELARVSAAFEEAGQAISTFASKLSELQRKADWYNRQIEAARQEQRAAQARQLHAQTEVRAAEARHSLASDPASLHTARAALEFGHGLLREAVAEVEDTVRRLSSLVAATVTLRAEYQAAVNACCGGLDSARHSGASSPLAWLSSLVYGLVGGVDGSGLAVWRFSRSVDRWTGGPKSVLGAFAKFFKDELPARRGGVWGARLVGVTGNPFYKFAGFLSIPFTFSAGYDDYRAAGRQSAGESWLGRKFTEFFFVGDEVASLHPTAGLVLGGADFLAGGELDLITSGGRSNSGALSADFKAIGLIGGWGITESVNRAEAEFSKHAGDGDLSAAWHVAGGFVGGVVDGALKGNEVWADNAAAGEYGGFVKGASDVVNFGVDHAYTGVEAASRGVSGAARGAWDSGGRLLRSL
jgi:uncharacterized protein YukE